MHCGHGIQFTDLDDIGSTSYIVNNSFSDNFGCALGVSKTNNVLVQNNFIFHSGPFSFEISGNNNIVRKNLIISTGTASKFLGASIVAEDNFLIASPFIFRGIFCKIFRK